MYKHNDLSGMLFGRLTVIKESGRTKDRHILWKCKCECGNTVDVSSRDLLSGHTKSCGCLQKDTIKTIRIKHGDRDALIKHFIPSAQPETHDKRTETHACDLIDRRALMKEFSDFVRASNNSDFAPRPTWNDAVSLVKSMPLVQQSSSCAHENDSVSRQAAIDAINKNRDSVFHDSVHYEDAVYDISNLPSAEPEIIYCRNCKHYVLHVLFGRSQGWCERLCDEFDKSLARGTEDDDFCSRAERREDD